LIAYKLFRILKNGEISSLFINKKLRLLPDIWYEAENHPTKGFKERPGWHCCADPIAPHLSTKDRKWFKVEINDYETLKRPASQGTTWYLAKHMKIIR